jgi:hypothetical protein
MPEKNITIPPSEDEIVPRYRNPGRPPRALKHKVSHPIRALVTIGVENAVNKSAEDKGLLLSDYLRLALYRALQADSLMTDELRLDATFDTLRKEGFV